MQPGKLIKKYLWKEESLIFGISFFILFNLGFHILIYFPLALSPDIQNYLSMAELDFDQSPVRRYRVIIPFFAYLLNTSFGWFFDLFHPWSFDSDFSLCFSFLLINTFIMSIVMMIIYKLCKSLEIERIYCFIAIIAVLSGRWTSELAGLPLIDSLYLLSLVFALYGLLTKQWIYIIVSIWLGPWTKEAYIFMVPIIIYFAKTLRLRMCIHLLLSGIFVFSFRFFLDQLMGQNMLQSLREDMSSFSSIGISLQRLFSFHGIYDMFSVIGFWFIIPILAILKYRNEFVRYQKEYIILFMIYLMIVIFQALLSTDLSRMFYLSIPVIAVWIGISCKLLKENLVFKE